MESIVESETNIGFALYCGINDPRIRTNKTHFGFVRLRGSLYLARTSFKKIAILTVCEDSTGSGSDRVNSKNGIINVVRKISVTPTALAFSSCM